MARTRRAKRLRGDFLLSGAFLASLAALLVNDLYLKSNLPGALSGVLSDIAGMVFFPILLVAAAEAVMILTPRRPFAAPSWFVMAALFVGAAFTIVKFTSWGEEIYSSVVNLVVQSSGAALSLGTSGVVNDPIDLLALLAVPVPILVGRRWRGALGVHVEE